MREFCQSPDCDGLINFGSDSDGEIGACEKCGRQYELKAEYYVMSLDDNGQVPKYYTVAKRSAVTGEKIAEIKLSEDE